MPERPGHRSSEVAGDDPAGSGSAMSGARPAGGGAIRVGAGILASRVVGFLRDRAIAHFFGVGPHADVFRTALRGPNILQNLLGEGTISASFIPIYSRLIEEGREREAGRFAGAIFGLLLATAGGLALLGVLAARPIVAVLAAGFLGDAARVAAGEATVDRFELAVVAVRIIFPMTGILVLAAWALGVLNSHRRFLLPYLAPVLWNASIIAAVFAVAARLRGLEGTIVARDRLLLAACVGALVGGLLQFLVQLPLVARLLRGFRLSFSTRVRGVKEALRAFVPVVLGRGAVQLSAYLDQLLASLLAPGAVAALGWAQTLYVLPISLFGMSVAAAELPELARESGRVGADVTSARIVGSLRRMAFVTVPTAIGYLLFGFLLVGAIYRTGRFTVGDNWLVALVLAGFSLGLVAASSSRLLQSAFYAVGDTATPSRIAVERVVLMVVIGVPAMFWLDRFGVADLPGLAVGESALRLGALGLAAATGCAAWYELIRLWRRLGDRLPEITFPVARIAVMAGLALAATAPAALLWRHLPALHVALTALSVLTAYAVIYLGAAHLLGLQELTEWAGRLSLVRRGR